MPTDPVNALLDQLTQKLNAPVHQDPVSMGLGDLLSNMFSKRRGNIALPSQSSTIDPRIAQLDPAQALARALGTIK